MSELNAPWTVDDQSIVDTTGMDIAFCGAAHLSEAESQERARLMAAAPEMYEALYRLSREADLDGLRDKAGWDYWLGLADAALAKARAS